jgi:hypothetical protein
LDEPKIIKSSKSLDPYMFELNTWLSPRMLGLVAY